MLLVLLMALSVPLWTQPQAAPPPVLAPKRPTGSAAIGDSVFIQSIVRISRSASMGYRIEGAA